MKIPLFKYLKSFFVSQRIVESDTKLKGLARANVLLQALVDENKVPGISISVLHDGKTVLQKGYGYADIENKISVDPQKTIFRIASVSKPIAATALAHMVSEGLIDLDASFYTYVPYYPKKKYDFTIRQLASHTAGIRSYLGTEYALNKRYSIKEGIDIFKDDDLLFKPGTQYHYNSYDWVLISLAMQEVSGIPFEEYVKDKVLNSLGMSNTFAECLPGHQQESEGEKSRCIDAILPETNVSKFYSKNRLGFRKALTVSNFYKLAGGGYLSTSKDIAHFGQSYLNHEILEPEIISQFLRSESINDKKTYYGLGWQVSEDKTGRPFYGHIGNGVGGYSNLFIYPEQKMVFAIITNCTNPKIQGELDEIVNELMHNDYLSTDIK